MSIPVEQILPDAVHFKEFYGGYNGTCGETALTAALICALQLGDTHDQAVALMLSVTAQMRAKGWADANGASTLWSLAREAVTNQGAHINTEWDYAEPFPHDWHSLLLANAAVRPVVLQVGRAYNLIGQDGTGHAEAGVHYHFVCVVGKCKDGYVVMDGDNYLIEQEFSIYSYETLSAADICGLLMLDITPKGTHVAVPSGWKDNGSVLTAPNGKSVVRGFRSYVIDHNPQWDANLQPLEEEWADAPNNVHQRFALTLEWNGVTNAIGEAGGLVPAESGVGAVPSIVTVPPASVPAAVKTDLDAAKSDLADAQAKVADAEGQL
jgi:hypothetical protein